MNNIIGQRIFLGLAFSFLWSGLLAAEKLSVAVESEAAILINAENGTILFEKNAYAPTYPASITKIATAIYALEEKENQLSAIVVAEQESIASISPEAKKRSKYSTPSFWIEQASTHMGIKKGEEFTLKDLLGGVMVVSANDASNVVAQYVGGTIPNFMVGLNKYLKDLGCKSTNFTNPHGLHHPQHQTTPYDMALITREAMKNPVFRELAAAPRFIRPKTNKQEPVVILQKNRLLRTGKYYYPKAIGVKNGYTSIARHTLVAAAKHEDRELIAVLMKCDEVGDIYSDAINLFNAAFNQAKVRKILLKAGPQKFTYAIEGAQKPIETYSKESLSYDYYPAEEPSVKCYLQWLSLKLPIAKDQPVGELQLKTTQGNIIQKISLYAQEDAQASWLQWIKDLL
jgi:serine-type D-Ala-D-Ala carboxypeptidase (penicillin-binding protein 5/6)